MHATIFPHNLPLLFIPVTRECDIVFYYLDSRDSPFLLDLVQPRPYQICYRRRSDIQVPLYLARIDLLLCHILIAPHLFFQPGRYCHPTAH